jgi:hypothetical protein
LWRRISGAECDDRASIEVSDRRHPLAALPPATGNLFERDQPVAFDGSRVGNQVGIGRTGALDDADAAQNSDPAAWSVSELSGPMRR